MIIWQFHDKTWTLCLGICLFLFWYLHIWSGLYGLPTRNGKLKELDKFDAEFFGIAPKQAENMDPQLRILLEVTYEAIVDAGITFKLKGSLQQYTYMHTYIFRQNILQHIRLLHSHVIDWIRRRNQCYHNNWIARSPAMANLKTFDARFLESSVWH